MKESCCKLKELQEYLTEVKVLFSIKMCRKMAAEFLGCMFSNKKGM